MSAPLELYQEVLTNPTQENIDRLDRYFAVEKQVRQELVTVIDMIAAKRKNYGFLLEAQAKFYECVNTLTGGVKSCETCPGFQVRLKAYALELAASYQYCHSVFSLPNRDLLDDRVELSRHILTIPNTKPLDETTIKGAVIRGYTVE